MKFSGWCLIVLFFSNQSISNLFGYENSMSEIKIESHYLNLNVVASQSMINEYNRFGNATILPKMLENNRTWAVISFERMLLHEASVRYKNVCIWICISSSICVLRFNRDVSNKNEKGPHFRHRIYPIFIHAGVYCVCIGFVCSLL